MSRPALTPEGREQQLIALAYDLVEQRLRDGTASSQETTHFLKLENSKARLELKRLEAETEMIIAKKESLQSQQRSEEMFQEAIAAFKRYSGQSDQDDQDYDY
jgi:regulator of replication initiation timing